MVETSKRLQTQEHATPVAQQIGANSLSESGSDSDALCRAQVNKIRTALINLGLTN